MSERAGRGGDAPNTDALAAVNARMLDGDAERGMAVLDRIGRLAGVTDRQQQYMYQTVALMPQDARDFLACLAANGIVMTAVPVVDASPRPPSRRGTHGTETNDGKDIR